MARTCVKDDWWQQIKKKGAGRKREQVRIDAENAKQAADAKAEYNQQGRVRYCFSHSFVQIEHCET